MDLLQYLKEQPLARERKNKNRAIGNIIIKKYNLYPSFQDKEKLADMVGEILLLDRYWRKHLKENPDLRGKDYGDKDRLEEQFVLKLGYNHTP